MGSREDLDRDEEKGGKKHIVVVVCIIAVAVLAVVLAVLFLVRRDDDAKDDEEKRSSVVTRDNLDTVLTDFNVEDYNPDTAQYIVTMSPTWRVNGDSSDAYVENSEFNSHSVYFDVLLADTEETIYQSPIIPLGRTIENFGLDKKLDPGTYQGVVVYHLVDDDQNTLTTVNVSVKIIVES